MRRFAAASATTALMDAMANPFKPTQACLDDAGWSQVRPTAATLIFAQFGLRFTGAVITGNHATTDAADTWPTYMDALQAIGRAAERFAAAANGGPAAASEA